MVAGKNEHTALLQKKNSRRYPPLSRNKRVFGRAAVGTVICRKNILKNERQLRHLRK